VFEDFERGKRKVVRWRYLPLAAYFKKDKTNNIH
jgi:hypothetical protein